MMTEDENGALDDAITVYDQVVGWLDHADTEDAHDSSDIEETKRVLRTVEYAVMPSGCRPVFGLLLECVINQQKAVKRKIISALGGHLLSVVLVLAGPKDGSKIINRLSDEDIEELTKVLAKTIRRA